MKKLLYYIPIVGIPIFFMNAKNESDSYCVVHGAYSAFTIVVIFELIFPFLTSG
jgi:hypothetical protein